MPALNGFELYRELKKQDGQVIFYFFTAFDVYRSEFEKIFPDISVKTFLKKPITLAQLVPRLKDIMNQRYPIHDGREERQP
jgi:response regulator RpfG family c-di-GMP phosphodiesterase